jgi:hypothetical protein
MLIPMYYFFSDTPTPLITRKVQNSKTEIQVPIQLLTEVLNWLQILDIESFAILLRAILTMSQDNSQLSNEAKLVFNSYLVYWKAIFEFAMGMFQNMAQMFRNTSESFLTILDYKYSEGKEEDEEKDSGESGEKADG